jgi:hypothetical protein
LIDINLIQLDYFILKTDTQLSGFGHVLFGYFILKPKNYIVFFLFYFLIGLVSVFFNSVFYFFGSVQFNFSVSSYETKIKSN